MVVVEKDYASLHNHTQYSNLKIIDSINREDRLIKYAYELNLSAIAITDHDCLSSHFNAIEAYKKLMEKEWSNEYNSSFPTDLNQIAKDMNFKLILGNEIYLTRENLNETNYQRGIDEFYHFILLAKDSIGHYQLRELSSRAWKRGGKWKGSIMRTPTYCSDLFDIVGKDPGHLIASTACLGGFVAKQTLLGNFDKIDNFIQQLSNLFGKDNFYLELQPSSTSSEQITFNKLIVDKYRDKYNFIFTTDSHYMKKEDAAVHKAFLNSKSSKDREVDSFYASAYMMSQQESWEYFKPYIEFDFFNQMCVNTQRISNQCQMFELSKPQITTKIPYENIVDYRELFYEDYNNRPYLKHYLFDGNETETYFIKLIARGWQKKYKKEWNWTRYVDRLEEELWTINEITKNIHQQMEDYFITMSKMMEIIWDKADSLVGPSRGSAGASIINYLLDITQMNPLEQELELPFWRFLHPDRIELPDIDFDTESNKRTKVFNELRKYFLSIGGDLINICTFGTEKSKSALQTASRGLNIPDESIIYLTSMIPNVRGNDWTLTQCYIGDEEHLQIKEFKNEIDKYPMLWEVASSIEGLITSLGCHASGVVAINGNFVEYNSIMKTNTEQLVSAYELHNSEQMGSIKYDMLTTSMLDRMHQTMNYLLEDKIIEWQGSLKKTYDKYLAPDVLDYTNPNMWKMIANGEIKALFQFDTIVGSQAIVKIKPQNLVELATANSAMRLMCEGEQPIDKFARFKHNIEEWYKEMSDYGLNETEQTLLKKYLLTTCGVAVSQESVMRLSMDSNISGFSMKEANKLRKTIAKKKFAEINNMQNLFYNKGNSLGTRKVLLDYIWNKQISLSLGYSFSDIHTCGYSLVALQEMNLASKYPIIYWNAACLSVDSSATNEEDFENLIDDGILSIAKEEDKRTSTKMNYAKIASAISSFKNNLKIELPDINKSKLGFTPNIENNTILYGLKGITKITDPSIEEIISHRPYKSLFDFCEKVDRSILTKDKIVNLIKSGAFNNLEHSSSTMILKSFILTVADQKNKLNGQNINMLIDYGFLDSFEKGKNVYKLTKELRANKDDKHLYYIASHIYPKNDKERNSWLEILKEYGNIKEMMLNEESCKVIDIQKWDKGIFVKYINPIKDYIKDNQEKLLNELNFKLYQEEYLKYAGNENELYWQLDSINFFETDHPLKNIINQLPIPITSINDLQEDTVEDFFFIKGKKVPKLKLFSIAGIVIDKNKVKGIVNLQTPEGVIEVKIYKNLFALYNHTLTTINEDGDTEILEDSFFNKGTPLLITGIKRGTTFVPKTYRNTGWKSIMKIELDSENNYLGLLTKEDNNE